MKEYQRFSPNSVNGSDSTAGLKRNIDKDDNKIIVTTIQKLNNLMKSEDTYQSIKNKLFSFLMSAIVLNSVKRKSYCRKSLKSIINLGLPVRLYSRKMRMGRKQQQACLAGNCIHT